MRPKHYGCFRSRHETRRQLHRSSHSLALFWSLLAVVLSGSRQEDLNITGQYHSPANFAAAAEARNYPSNSNDVPRYSSTGRTVNTVSASDSGGSERSHFAPFSAVQAARVALMPIKLHGSTTTVVKFKDRGNHKESRIDSETDTAEDQQVSLAQSGYAGQVHDTNDKPRTAGDSYSASAEYTGTALTITPVQPESRTKEAPAENPFNSSLMWPQSFSAIADDRNALQALRASCANCGNTTSALEGNRTPVGIDDGLQRDESVVPSTSRASLVATSASVNPKTNDQKESPRPVTHYASLHAPYPLGHVVDNANSVAETRLHERAQENMQDSGAGASPVRVNFSSATALAGKNVVVSPAWLDMPPDTSEPSGAQGGDSGTTHVPARGASGRRSRRGRRLLPRSLRAKQRGTTESRFVGSDSSAVASESPIDRTTSSTETSSTAPEPPFAPPFTGDTHEQNNSVTLPEEDVTVPAADPTATLEAEEEGLRTSGRSSQKAEPSAYLNNDKLATGNAYEEGLRSGAGPSSEDSLASGGSSSEGDTTMDAAVAAGPLTNRLKKKSGEALTTRENTVESTTESDISTLGSRFNDDGADGTEESPGNAAKPEDGAGKREQEQKEEKSAGIENIYKKATTTTPATNYLGAGYDPVKGNPAGDPTLMGDPGLRAPVIRLEYEQTAAGVSNDLTILQPLNGFVRPYIACRQSEAVTEIHSLHDYQKELAVDAALSGGDFLGANSFSGSAGYRELAKEIASKTKKVYMLKRYCIRFEAGLAQSSNVMWALTSAFAAGVQELPTKFDGKDPKCACTPDQWRQDHTVPTCQSTNIPTWIRFLEQFGTHFVVHLFAGGKMTYQVSMSAAEARKAKKRGVNVEAQLKIQLGMYSAGGATKNKFESESNSHKSELKIETETLVIGGRPPPDLSDANALAAWVESVDNLPMPVKMEVQPLKHLLPAAKQDAFLDAAAYYGRAVGMSMQDLNLLTGEVKTLPGLLGESAQIAWAGPPPGFAQCPPGKVVVYGVAMYLSFADHHLDKYHLMACTPGREKCDGVGVSNSDLDDARIYIACGDEMLNEVQQVVTESQSGENERGIILTATCPDDTVVAAGFGFSYGAGRGGLQAFDIEACKAGQTVCTKAPSPLSSKSFIWLVCVDKHFPGVRHVNNVVGLGSVGKANKHAPDKDGEVEVRCPDGSKVVQGFVMEVHTSFQRVRDRFSHCKAGIDRCTISGKGVDKGGMLRTDQHALLGWCLCDSGPELGSHVASDSQRKARIRMQKAMQKSKSTAGDAVVSDTDVNPHEDSRKRRQGTPDSSAKRRRRRGHAPESTSGAEAAPVQTSSQPVDSGASTGGDPADHTSTFIERTTERSKRLDEAVERSQSEL